MVRPKLCPGCQAPKAEHSFGPPGKMCTGQEEHAESYLECNDVSDISSTLLEAVQTAQLQSIIVKQDSMEQKLEGRQTSGKQIESNQSNGGNHGQEQNGVISIPRKFGEYIDFGEVLLALTLRFTNCNKHVVNSIRRFWKAHN